MIEHMLSWILLNANWNLEEWKWITSWSGRVVFLIIEVPVLLLVLSAILGRPRRLKITGLFIIVMIILFAGFIATTWILGSIMSFFIP